MTFQAPFIATQLNSTKLDVQLSRVVSLQMGPVTLLDRLELTSYRHSFFCKDL